MHERERRRPLQLRSHAAQQRVAANGKTLPSAAAIDEGRTTPSFATPEPERTP